MPECDGLEFLEFLRIGYSKKIPVIFITGYDDINRDEAVARGAQDLLEKPFKLSDMYNKVISTLNPAMAVH